MKIQQLTIADESENQISVELQISEKPELEDSDEYLVAVVRLPKPPQSRTLGKLQLDALQALIDKVGQVSDEVAQNLRADR